MMDQTEHLAIKLAAALSMVLERKRQSMALSQEELSRRAGLSRTYLSDIERGLRNISVGTLSKIAEALGTSASGLLEEAERTALKDDEIPETTHPV